MKPFKPFKPFKIKCLLIVFLSIIIFSCNKDENVTACFTYTYFNDTVKFDNCSQNATSYSWEFNGKISSTDENPIFITSGITTPLIVKLTAKNNSYTNVLSDTIYDWVMVYKPNIYLYPTKNTNICVELSFPKGGKIVNSEPLYNNGWCVNVQPNGIIDNAYNYLFYESAQPNIWQKNTGYCIQRGQLTQFLKNDMQKRHFTDTEINDFLDYWIPILNTYNYYLIYPQTKQIIDKVIKVTFNQNPMVFYRLFYGFKGVNQPANINPPVIESFEREGFVAVEWGGYIL